MGSCLPQNFSQSFWAEVTSKALDRQRQLPHSYKLICYIVRKNKNIIYMYRVIYNNGKLKENKIFFLLPSNSNFLRCGNFEMYQIACHCPHWTTAVLYPIHAWLYKMFFSNCYVISGSVDILRPVKSLDCLLHLRLHNSVRGVSNPLCMRQNYKQELCNYMPKLDTLDGEVLRGPSMHKYCVGMAIYDRNLVDKLWKGLLDIQWVKTVCDWVRFYQGKFLWF